MISEADSAAREATDRRNGIFAALGAYGVWGVFPVLFHALDAVNPLAIVANRVIWSFLLVGGILSNRKRLGEVRAALTSASSARGIAISALLLSVNWLIFVWAVQNNNVLEVSFGYFINPLVSVAIGMILLGERLNRWQGVAIGVAIVAVGVQSLGVAGLPLVSLALALSFGFYGYFRKTVNVGSAPGLFVETLMLLPLALIYVGWEVSTGQAGAYTDPWLLFLLVMTGPATSGALLMFAFAARRLRLSSMGMFQYIAPSMHFMLAVWAFGEPIDTMQLLSFGLIWLSLAIYSYDSIKRRPKATVLADGGIASAGKR